MKITIAGKEFDVKDENIKLALEKGEGFTIDSDVIIRTEEEQKTWFDNKFKEAKQGTINTAFEMEVKKHKNALGLEFEGKSFDDLFKALQDKTSVEATKTPNELLDKASKERDHFKALFETTTKEKEDALNDFKSYKDNSFIDSTILKAIPSNTVIPKDDLLFLIKSKLNPSREEGKLVFKKDGEILKNKTTLEPLAIDKVFETYFAENKHYIKGVEGGQGGSDSSGQINPKGLDAYIKKASDSGVNVNSAEFSKQMSQAYASGEIVD